jgi:hypothetical protein
VGEVRIDSDEDDGGVTLPPPFEDVLRLNTVSVRDRLLETACCSVGNRLVELSVRLDLSMDLGTAAFSFSDDDDDGGGGARMTSASVSEAEEMARAVCDAVRRRRVEFDGNMWTGYGDSWLKCMEFIDGLLRDFCS